MERAGLAGAVTFWPEDFNEAGALNRLVCEERLGRNTKLLT